MTKQTIKESVNQPGSDYAQENKKVKLVSGMLTYKSLKGALTYQKSDATVATKATVALMRRT